MRYLKILGLAAVAAAALMAFVGAGTASAETTLCTETTTPCPAGKMWGPGQAGMTEIHAESEPGTGFTQPTLTAPFGNISCDMTINGPIESTTTPKGKATALNITNCKGGTAHTVTLGTNELHWDAEHNGKLTIEGFVVTVEQAGVTCYYGGAINGTLTGSATPTLEITAEAKVIDTAVHNSDLFCPGGAATHAAFKVTNGAMYVHEGV